MNPGIVTNRTVQLFAKFEVNSLMYFHISSIFIQSSFKRIF